MKACSEHEEAGTRQGHNRLQGDARKARRRADGLTPSITRAPALFLLFDDSWSEDMVNTWKRNCANYGGIDVSGFPNGNQIDFLILSS